MAHVLLTCHYKYETFEVVTGTRFSRTAGYLRPEADTKRIEGTFFYMCVFVHLTHQDGWNQHYMQHLILALHKKYQQAKRNILFIKALLST